MNKNDLKQIDSLLVKRLKTFATKNDLKQGLSLYATKEDLKQELVKYATRDDLRQELSKYATKQDLDEKVNGLEKKVNGLEKKLLDKIDEAEMNIIETVDKHKADKTDVQDLVKRVAKLEHPYD